MQIDNQIESLAAYKEQGLNKTLGEIFEENYYRNIFDVQQMMGQGSAFAVLDERKIKQAVSKPWRYDGKTYYVPSDMKYTEWKEKYVDNRVETVYNKKQKNFLQEQLPFMNNGETLFIPTNTVIKSATVIAGNGSDTVLRKKEWLAETYGGNAEEWKKCVGKIESDKYLIDVHWYELGKKQYGAKVKFVKEK